MTNELSNSEKQKKRRTWTSKRRQEQAERAKTQKPWKQSTGPRSPQGKATVANNPYSHGFRSRDMAKIRALLRREKLLIQDIFNASFKDKGVL